MCGYVGLWVCEAFFPLTHPLTHRLTHGKPRFRFSWQLPAATRLAGQNKMTLIIGGVEAFSSETSRLIQRVHHAGRPNPGTLGPPPAHKMTICLHNLRLLGAQETDYDMRWCGVWMPTVANGEHNS